MCRRRGEEAREQVLGNKVRPERHGPPRKTKSNEPNTAIFGVTLPNDL